LLVLNSKAPFLSASYDPTMARLSLPTRRKTPLKANGRDKVSKYPSHVVGQVFDKLSSSAGFARNPRTVRSERLPLN
jgi:hypothetical protein